MSNYPPHLIKNACWVCKLVQLGKGRDNLWGIPIWGDQTYSRKNICLESRMGVKETNWAPNYWKQCRVGEKLSQTYFLKLPIFLPFPTRCFPEQMLIIESILFLEYDAATSGLSVASLHPSSQYGRGPREMLNMTLASAYFPTSLEKKITPFTECFISFSTELITKA